MKLMRALKYVFFGVLAMVFAQCNTVETVESSINLPVPLLMQKSDGSSFKIVVMRTDKSMTDLGGGLSPRWSPDGSRIAFWANSPTGLNDIFSMNSDGSDLRNLTASASIYESRPVWSPTGSMIAFDEDAPGTGKGVGIMNSDGTHRHFVSSKNSNNAPRWFPNGGSLLFQRAVGSRLEIHSVNSDGTGDTALSTDTTKSFANGSISPNGAYLSYSRGDTSSLTFTAMIIRDLATGHENEFLGAIIGYVWSPQSDWLYCTESTSRGNTIVRISPTSKVKEDLSQKPLGRGYNDIVSSLSSDGKWLAFSSDQSGSALIYMMDADGSNKQQITFDPQFTSPFWKP